MNLPSSIPWHASTADAAADGALAALVASSVVLVVEILKRTRWAT